ncbi:hypothetical protein ACP275_14G103300 [Erythranthe tilingii]
MAASKALLLVMVACILSASVAQPPSAAPSPSPTAAAASPSFAPTYKSTPPASSPSPAAVVNSPPPTPSPSAGLPPSPSFAPQPSANGAVANGLGFAAAAAGFFTVAFMA